MPLDVAALLRETGALLSGHFRLSSGLHSSGYMQSALVLQHPADATALGTALATKLRELRPDVVLSPALGGIIIGHEVARAFGTPFLFTERDPETRQMSLRRGFSVQPGDTAVVVEDVITTGGSTQDVVFTAAIGNVLQPGATNNYSVAINTGQRPVHTTALQSFATHTAGHPECSARPA